MNWLHRRRERRAKCAPPPSADVMRLAAAINGAWIVERNANIDADGNIEPRVFVTCPTLRGTFIFSPESAERRIRLAFPDLDDAAITVAVRHLVDRVSGYLTEKTLPDVEPRRSFVRDWAADDGEWFRF
ncbi:MAG: hypothetical protein ACTHL5_11370 [Rhodanobacter sp.]